MSEPRYVTNSELQALKQCRRQWYLGYYRRLAKRHNDGSGKAAQTGTLVHDALEQYYKDPARDASKVLVDFRKRRITDPEADTYAKEYALADAMIDGYFEWLSVTGADQDLIITAVEGKITCPAPAPFDEMGVELLGKLDLVAERDGILYTLDHKDQPLDSKVLTPFGWKRNGDLKLGEIVSTPEGGNGLVTGIFQKGEQPVYVVKFKDGSSARAGAGHLWTVTDVISGETAPKTTVDILERLTSGDRYRYSTPVPIIEFPERTDLLLPPYVLGVWLGDGSNHGTTVTCGEADQPEMVQHLVDAGTPVSTGYKDPQKLHLRKTRWLLSALDLIGSKCKHIPEQYLQGSIEQRMELLRGLLDSDGHCDTHGRVRFITVTPELRYGIEDLVRSLGGAATTSEFENDAGTPTWHVSIRIPDDLGPPFRLSRKVERYLSFDRRDLRHVIVAVEPDGVAETQCIEVSPGHHYITDDYKVTHNTVQGFDSVISLLPMNEQSRHYAVIQRRNNPDRPIQGSIWNMLRKVKRTATAKPPFYLRSDIAWSDKQLAVFWHRLHGEITVLLELQAALDAGADHQEVAYPTPSNDCTWRCPFYAVCPHMDDPRTDSESLIDVMYVQWNPLERYDNPDNEETT
jgi:hypothetical protein